MRCNLLFLLLFLLSFSGHGQVYKLSLDEMEAFIGKGPLTVNNYLVPKGWLYVPEDSTYSTHLNSWEFPKVDKEGDTTSICALQCYHYLGDATKETHSVWYHTEDKAMYDELMGQGNAKGMKKIASGVDKDHGGTFNDYKIKGYPYVLRFRISTFPDSTDIAYIIYLIERETYKDHY